MNILDRNLQTVKAANFRRLYGRGKVQKEVLINYAVCSSREEGEDVREEMFLIGG
jgi:hypothetical protein